MLAFWKLEWIRPSWQPRTHLAARLLPPPQQDWGEKRKNESEKTHGSR